MFSTGFCLSRKLLQKQKRIVRNDLNRFKQTPVEQFTNLIMRDGKKQLALQQIQDMFLEIQKQTKQDPLQVFLSALDQVSPIVSTATVRKKSKNLIAPQPLNERQRFRIGGVWMIEAANKASKRVDFGTRLAHQVLQVFKGESSLFQTKEQMHKLALANRSSMVLRDRT
ncbi:ribosomal protein S7 domain-containing protein [Gorgonomyces haynaldii]|nr:ribosomal protein S7 domain-containing protein [Gorgonomyces haynaldii]